MTCPVFRPDHNGECLNCDEWADEHTPAAIEAGAQLAAHPHAQVASDCWRLIRALDSRPTALDPEFEAAARNLIEIACDSAAEAERARLGHRPKDA